MSQTLPARSQTAPPPPAVTAPAGDEDDLPEGWAVAMLQEVGLWRSGGTPSRTKPEFFGIGIPWVKSGDLPDGPIQRTDEQITQAGLDNSAAKLMPTGTICMALYGATIGKLGVMTFPAATNQATANLVHNELLVERQFVFLYLMSERQRFIDLGQGGAQPNISQEIVRNHPITLPPLAEQRRIVGVLEGLLGKVAASRERLARVPQLLKRFRQSVLAAACSGKLTNDWREENDTSDDVVKVVSAIQQRRQRSAKTVAMREKLDSVYANVEIGDASEFPESWRLVTLNKLCQSFDYGTSAKSEPNGRVPVLRMGNIQDGNIDWTGLVYTSDEAEIAKYTLLPNTVLFNRTNSPELVGKTAIYRGERPAIFAGYLIRVNNCDELDSEYLNFCLNSNDAREFCNEVKTDGVSQSNINAQKLGAFEIPFPPLAEQHEIVRRVEQLFALADRLEAQLAAARTRVDRLTQSILAKAFRGELVPTEADLARREARPYEPAHELLARIRDQQTTTKPTKAPRKPRKTTGE